MWSFVCPSVRPTRAFNWKTKGYKKPRLACPFSRTRINGMPILSSKVQGQCHRALKSSRKWHILRPRLLTDSGSCVGRPAGSGASAGSSDDCERNLTKPVLLSVPKTFCNCGDDRVHVGTRLGVNIFLIASCRPTSLRKCVTYICAKYIKH